MEAWEILLTIAVGIGVGFFSALFGVGGGVFIVPFVVLVLGESQHFAEGTSLLAIVPIAAVGAAAHARKGYVSWRPALLLALGGAAGAVAGVLLAYQLSGENLRKLFGAFLLAMAARTTAGMLRSARGSGDATGPAVD